MSKYHEKILEIANDADSIIEMVRKKKLSTLEKIMDFVVTSSVSVIDSLNMNGAYYLVTKGEKHKLVHITRELEIEGFDVTNEVENSSNPKKFEYKGNYYKTFKKVV